MEILVSIKNRHVYIEAQGNYWYNNSVRVFWRIMIFNIYVQVKRKEEYYK